MTNVQYVNNDNNRNNTNSKNIKFRQHNIKIKKCKISNIAQSNEEDIITIKLEL